jgi:hypothetical protein
MEKVPMTLDLTELLKAAKAKVDAMTPDEREAMLKAQRDSYVKAEMSRPKPKFKWINGVKVYASYEDYCNG